MIIGAGSIDSKSADERRNHSPLFRLKVEHSTKSCQYARHECVWGSGVLVPYIFNLGTRLR